MKVRLVACGGVAAAIGCLVGPTFAAASSDTIQVPRSPQKVVEFNQAVLRFVKAHSPNNYGYPTTWTASVGCSVPRFIHAGSKFHCSVFFDEPGHMPLLNEGTATVKIPKITRAHPGYNFTIQLSSSVDPYAPALYAPTTTTTTIPATTTTPAPRTTTSSGPHATATGCQGTYKYNGGTVTATLNTQGPALVSFTSTANNPQIEVVSASVNLMAGQNSAVGSMTIKETPTQVTAVVVTENADGGPSGASSSCTLTKKG